MSGQRNGGVRGSQRDELQEERALAFTREMHRSITAAAKGPPEWKEIVSAMWSALRMFQQQQFEQEGLLSHVATEAEVNKNALTRIEAGIADIKKSLEPRASRPLLDADASGVHRAQVGDVTALQQQIEAFAKESTNNFFAVSTQLGKVLQEIGNAPRPEAASEEERNGSGIKRQIAVLFALRSRALFGVGAVIGGGGIFAIIFELFRSFIIPHLLH